jgi:uridine phosphorylase
VNAIITCGGCGVLKEIPVGDVIIPNVALRDEGASYHYLPPSRDIILDTDILNIIKLVLSEYSVPYIECKTWTTDAFYRETPDMISYRKEEGCEVVEMECATIAAIARFRGVKFGQLLYSGDILTNFENYDERAWMHNLSAREKLFSLSLQVAKRVCNNIPK